MAEYDLTPVSVPKVSTKFRTIKTRLPVPQSLPIFRELQRSEPRSMRGQPPIVWHKADNFSVSDKWGNRWIDWSSCVLIANAGHNHPKIAKALHEIIDQGLLSTYVFIHEGRAKLTGMLQKLAPQGKDYSVFLLSSGSEATENCIKMAKTYAIEKYGPKRKYFVSFNNAFHGRTLAAQLAGGMPKLKTWIVDGDRTFIQVPFPDGYKNEDVSFDYSSQVLKNKALSRMKSRA